MYDEGDNPPNWCRNGHFPALTHDYSLGELTANAAMVGDGKDTCPSEDPAKCDVDKTLAAGVPLAVSKPFGDFSCVFDPSDQSAGWVPSRLVRFFEPQAIRDADWIDVWSDGSNRVEIVQSAEGLHVVGTAQWFGTMLESGEQVVHDGGIDFSAKPDGDRLVLRAADSYECGVELIHLRRFLVVRDNSYCGGANVRFNGVYQRK
ncbi:MAG: hypothetical protein KL863_03635 [Rhizobium sp.]|nr:hypothetical protein [Rhizobium sp.]